MDTLDSDQEEGEEGLDPSLIFGTPPTKNSARKPRFRNHGRKSGGGEVRQGGAKSGFDVQAKGRKLRERNQDRAFKDLDATIQVLGIAPLLPRPAPDPASSNTASGGVGGQQQGTPGSSTSSSTTISRTSTRGALSVLDAEPPGSSRTQPRRAAPGSVAPLTPGRSPTFAEAVATGSSQAVEAAAVLAKRLRLRETLAIGLERSSSSSGSLSLPAARIHVIHSVEPDVGGRGTAMEDGGGSGGVLGDASRREAELLVQALVAEASEPDSQAARGAQLERLQQALKQLKVLRKNLRAGPAGRGGGGGSSDAGWLAVGSLVLPELANSCTLLRECMVCVLPSEVAHLGAEGRAAQAWRQAMGLAELCREVRDLGAGQWGSAEAQSLQDAAEALAAAGMEGVATLQREFLGDCTSLEPHGFVHSTQGRAQHLQASWHFLEQLVGDVAEAWPGDAAQRLLQQLYALCHAAAAAMGASMATAMAGGCTGPGAAGCSWVDEEGEDWWQLPDGGCTGWRDGGPTALLAAADAAGPMERLLPADEHVQAAAWLPDTLLALLRLAEEADLAVEEELGALRELAAGGESEPDEWQARRHGLLHAFIHVCMAFLQYTCWLAHQPSALAPWALEKVQALLQSALLLVRALDQGPLSPVHLFALRRPRPSAGQGAPQELSSGQLIDSLAAASQRAVCALLAIGHELKRRKGLEQAAAEPVLPGSSLAEVLGRHAGNLDGPAAGSGSGIDTQLAAATPPGLAAPAAPPQVAFQRPSPFAKMSVQSSSDAMAAAATATAPPAPPPPPLAAPHSSKPAADHDAAAADGSAGPSAAALLRHPPHKPPGHQAVQPAAAPRRTTTTTARQPAQPAAVAQQLRSAATSSALPHAPEASTPGKGLLSSAFLAHSSGSSGLTETRGEACTSSGLTSPASSQAPAAAAHPVLAVPSRLANGHSMAEPLSPGGKSEADSDNLSDAAGDGADTIEQELAELAAQAASWGQTGAPFWFSSWAALDAQLELTAQLGSGSFGHVWRGTLQGAEVAVKFLYVKAWQQAGVLRQHMAHFRHEVELHRRLVAHHRVVSIIAACCDVQWALDKRRAAAGQRLEGGGGAEPHPPKMCIVLELCNRGTLNKLLRRAEEVATDAAAGASLEALRADRRHLPRWQWTLAVAFYSEWRMRLGIAAAVAEGVQFLHASGASGILHRDLTSSNLLLHMVPSVTGGGALTVKVCDFNLSHEAQPNGLTYNLPETHSPAYMPPEIFMNGSYGKAADVFAFGVILWELITLQMPWADENKQGMQRLPFYIASNVSAGSRLPLPLPEAIVPPLPEAVDVLNMVRACWEQDAARRPTMDSVVKDLGETLKRMDARRARGAAE